MVSSRVFIDALPPQKRALGKGGVSNVVRRSLEDILVAMTTLEMHQSFPVFYKIYCLLLLLPVSTASSERTFSAMKLIKTRLRTTMADEWLNNLMLLYINRDLANQIEPEDILLNWYLAEGNAHKVAQRKAAELLMMSEITNPDRVRMRVAALERRQPWLVKAAAAKKKRESKKKRGVA